MLYLYSLFHLNLMFSSISVQDRKQVIDKCYWPLLELVKSGTPVAIEAPALTLEMINSLSPAWITTLKEYLKEGLVEFVGSGYSQVIGPLVPAKLNEKNQKLGLESYKKLLEYTPTISLVNEMAFSSGVVDHYVGAGYKAIIMEWNNPKTLHPEWNNFWRFYPQQVSTNNGHLMPIIWADSIAFQKFQRYAHDNLELEEYLNFIKANASITNRYFPLYSNDVEIFDFRPGRFQTEASLPDSSEWMRISQLYKSIQEESWCKLVLPSEVLTGLSEDHGGHELKLESPRAPIPVKKQEKYNINRWALSGRNDLLINSMCYQIYDNLLAEGSSVENDWKELCYLWSSDFRTHINEERWTAYLNRLNDNKYNVAMESNVHKEINSKGHYVVSENTNEIVIWSNQVEIILNKRKGCTIKSLLVKGISNQPLLGTLDHGYYDDITLGADYYSGHSVIEEFGEHKVTDLGRAQADVINDGSVHVHYHMADKNFKFENSITLNERNLTLTKAIYAEKIGKYIVRPFTFTLIPESWDIESLYIATHNGGYKEEKYELINHNISHSDLYSSLISSRHGFGNSEGVFIIGDKDKSISIDCDMRLSALIPSIVYKETSESFFFRLQYSAQELDETLKAKPVSIKSSISIRLEDL